MTGSPSRRRRRGETKADSAADKTRPKGQESPTPGAEGYTSPEKPDVGFLMKMRGWVDALVIAYVLAMFIRTYVVELFKIPTGSMTPTLVGDNDAVEMDYNGDGVKDLIIFFRIPHGSSYTLIPQVFLKKGGKYVQQLWVLNPSADFLRTLLLDSHPRKDMILVNKFYYWFHHPSRGDIIVFKVPNRPELNKNGDPNRRNPWDPTKPIFIKRCVGLPGDRIHLAPPRLVEAPPDSTQHVGPDDGTEVFIHPAPVLINGKPLDTPSVFDRVGHFPYGFEPWHPRVGSQEYDVPKGDVFMMGDNSANSADSRAWGPLPENLIRGKAIFRYWPPSKISFLE